MRNLTVRSSRNKINSFLLNFGPQHPAAHGILKISLAFSGEVITRADLGFGLLHRGSEKLCEARTPLQAIPYMDRMDYVANLIQENALVSSFETLYNEKQVTIYDYTIRAILDELSRVLNHLLTLSAVCLDLGAMGPMFWAFEEREIIMTFYEKLSGARMHTALYRPFGFGGDALLRSALSDLHWIINRGARIVNGSFVGLLNNRALRSRCSHIGSFSPQKVKGYGISGIIARASGVSVDSRLGLGAASYGIYNTLSFNTYVGRRGDAMERFILRVREITESYYILTQAVNVLNTKISRNNVYSSNSLESKFTSMEGLINHFKHSTESLVLPSGVTTSVIESPKGFVGASVVSNGGRSPYRVAVRSPVAHNLHLLATAANGYTFADFVATFCSMDVVLGEIDR